MLEIPAACGSVPAYPLVPAGYAPGKTGKLGTSRKRNLWPGNIKQIPQMGSKRNFAAEVMVTVNQLPPEITL
jgi:hypothetical protein